MNPHVLRAGGMERAPAEAPKRRSPAATLPNEVHRSGSSDAEGTRGEHAERAAFSRMRGSVAAKG
jgi:hypothetical protein